MPTKTLETISVSVSLTVLFNRHKGDTVSVSSVVLVYLRKATYDGVEDVLDTKTDHTTVLPSQPKYPYSGHVSVSWPVSLPGTRTKL